MQLLPIRLSVKRGSFRADDPSPPPSDAIYKAARQVVLKRDDFTCRFCGFRHLKNEVHHANDNHHDHSEGNLITACVLCHMDHHIAFAGIRGRGTLIYLHEADISQAGLNQLVRTLWIAEEIARGDVKTNAQQILARLERAEILATQVIGTTRPDQLGDFMSGMSDEMYKQRGTSLAGIYLLPKKSAYIPYLKLWVQDAKQFGPEDWLKKAKDKFAQWSENI